MKKYRRLPVAMVAACLTVGLVAAPSAVAASPKAKTSASKVTARSVNSKLNKTNKSLTSTRKSLSKLSKDLGGLSTRLKSGEGSIALLLGAAPQLVTGLQTLAGAVQTQIAPGLLQLKTALENDVAPALKKVRDELAPAVQKLGDNYTADEYGIVQLAVEDDEGPAGPDAGTAPDALPGCFYETGNIPDNVQSAIVSGQCLVPPGTTVGTDLIVLAGIRSNEVDGTGAANAAGVAGIVAYSQRNAAGALQGAGATASDGPPAVIGPTVLIPTKSAPTSTTETSFPFAPISTDNLVDIADTRFTGTPANPVLTAVGNTVDVTVRFVDLTPADKDPKQ